MAYLNQIGVIDAIISDDVDNFLFGAEVVIRKSVINVEGIFLQLLTTLSPSATLTGNNAHPKKNSAGKVDDMHVMIYTAKAIKEHPDVQLTQGGCILIGIMSGGDYIVVRFMCAFWNRSHNHSTYLGRAPKMWTEDFSWIGSRRLWRSSCRALP